MVKLSMGTFTVGIGALVVVDSIVIIVVVVVVVVVVKAKGESANYDEKAGCS